MIYNTAVSQNLSLADYKAQYDEHVKRILSNKAVLARILQGAVAEFKPYSIDEIIECIDSEILISKVPVRPGASNISQHQSVNNPENQSILGDRNEDAVPDEGVVTFDIRFHTFVPDKSKEYPIKLLLNIEAQKTYYTNYHLVTRGIFYGSRMISAQLDTEFTNSDYDNIKKVYSIWICMNAPKKIGNAMVEYGLKKTDLINHVPDDRESYDKLSVVMIYLNERTTYEWGGIHHFLNTLLSPSNVRKRKRILIDVFHMVMEENVEEEMNDMCNLSDLIEERGIAKGISKGISIGKDEGIRIGNEAKTKTIIRNMLNRGMADEDIMALAECDQTLIDIVRKESI